MTAERSRLATGYPPVTEAEEQKATETALTPPPSRGANRLDADGKLVVDAMAAVFDEHRRRIATIALKPEEKHYLLDLLDAVFLDLLQVVLNEASAVEQVLQRPRVAP